MTITKADLGNTLFDEVGLNKREAKDFVELFFEKVRQSLEEGTAVKLSGFGSFTLRDKTPRPGRNPKTGEEVKISRSTSRHVSIQSKAERKGGSKTPLNSPKTWQETIMTMLDPAGLNYHPFPQSVISRLVK